MHATHIEDEFEDVERPSYVKRSPGSRARATADYDDESVIQGVHRGDENREIGGVAATSSARPQTEIAIVQTERDGDSVRPLHVTRRVPYVLGNDDRGRRIYSNDFKRPVSDYSLQRHNSWLQSVHQCLVICASASIGRSGLWSIFFFSIPKRTLQQIIVYCLFYLLASFCVLITQINIIFST